MSIARPLQTLNLYDVLTDLIPGAVCLILAYSLFPTVDSQLSGNTGSLVFIVLVGSFVLGQMIQWARGHSTFWKQPNVFQHTMRSIRIDLRRQTPEPDNKPKTMQHALPTNKVRRSFIDLVDQQFGFDNTVSDGQRFQHVLSYLETRPSVRALRFQSYYSFHRSMVVAAWIGIILSILAFVFHCTGLVNVRSWPILVASLSFSVGLAYTSRSRRDKFEKVFVSYVIREFYQEQISNDENY